MLRKIPYTEAVQLLLELPRATKAKTLDLFDAQGFILAQDIVAAMNVPPFDRSPYDGYAFRGEDSAGASDASPVTLRIIEEIPAGCAPQKEIESGTAAKILTGGPLPRGANCIVKFEDTSFTDETVTLRAPIAPNTDVVRAGEDIALGTVLAKKGDFIEAALLAVIASQGISQVLVYEKPRIAVITTGSELLMPGDEYQAGKIYNTNLFSLIGFLRDAGMQALNFGSVKDDADEIAKMLSQALCECDAVITTGGASVGDYDFAVSSAEKCGANVLFWKTIMKPGGAIVASEKDGKAIISLSGNPSAALTALNVVAMPYLKMLGGSENPVAPRFMARLKKPLRKKTKPTRFLRGHIEIENGEALFLSHDSQGNGDTLSFKGCTAIAEIAANSPPLEAGEMVSVFYI